MPNVLRKVSTLTRKAWIANPARYNEIRDKSLTAILESNPRMNVHVVISKKPF